MKWKTEYYESKRGKDGHFHFIYKTTNKINNKFYIGVHNTNDLGDGYKGSGNIIREAFKKYGKKNFIYEILEFFDTIEEAYDKEREIINETLVNDPMCYNIMIGGKGGSLGYIPMKNINTGKVELVNTCNIGDEYVSVNKNNIPVYDKLSNKYIRIDRDDFDESIHIPMHKGKIVLYNTITNECEQVFVDDPRRKSGELISISKGKVTVTDGNGNWFQVDKNHPDYISGKLKTYSKNKWTLRNKLTKECISVEKNSDVDWNIYEFSTCRLKKSDNPNLIYARLIGDKKFKYYDKNDPRLSTYDLLLPTPKGYRNVYVTNGYIDIALHESELNKFFEHHPNWYKGHRKYTYKSNIKNNKRWVNNGVENKVLNKEELDNFLKNNSNWKRGCLIKKNK